MIVDQFLTYATTRDLLEDNCDKLRQLRLDLKKLQWGEQQREREEAAIKWATEWLYFLEEQSGVLSHNGGMVKIVLESQMPVKN